VTVRLVALTTALTTALLAASCAAGSTGVMKTYDGSLPKSAIGENSGLVIANSESWQEGDGNMRLVVQYSHPSPGVCEPIIVSVVRMLGGTKHWQDGVPVELRASGRELVKQSAQYEQLAMTLGVEETLTIAPVAPEALDVFFAASDAVIVVAGEPHGLPASMRDVGRDLLARHRACP
jgi:hypothetical protein